MQTEQQNACSMYDYLEFIYFQTQEINENFAETIEIADEQDQDIVQQLNDDFKKLSQSWLNYCEGKVQHYERNKQKNNEEFRKIRKTRKQREQQIREYTKNLLQREQSISYKGKELNKTLDNIKTICKNNVEDLQCSLKDQESMLKKLRDSQSLNLSNFEEQMKQILSDDDVEEMGQELKDTSFLKALDLPLQQNFGNDSSGIDSTYEEISESRIEALDIDSPSMQQIQEALGVLCKANVIGTDSIKLLLSQKVKESQQEGQKYVIPRLQNLSKEQMDSTQVKRIFNFYEDPDLSKTIPSNPISSRSQRNSLEEEVEELLKGGIAQDIFDQSSIDLDKALEEHYEALGVNYE